MPRYEIVAHAVCDLDGVTPEEAAAEFRRGLVAGASSVTDVRLRHLAVWREGQPAASPLPVVLRQHLADFFADVERSAAEAEAAFRLRVAEILAVVATSADGDAGAPGDAAPLDQTDDRGRDRPTA